MKKFILCAMLLLPATLVLAEPVRMDTSVTQETGTLTKTADMNRDGRPDHWWYSLRDGDVMKIERDLDFSGTVSARQWTFLRNKEAGKFEKMLYEDVAVGKVVQIDYYDA